MKKIFTLSLALSLMLIMTSSSSYAQNANVTLSNLTSPTAINQNLLPNKDNKLNLGSSAKGWKRFYLTDGMYHDTVRIFFVDTTNTAVGTNTLTVSSGKANTAAGSQALRSNSSGLFNTGIGASALLYNTSGSANTAVGGSSLYTNENGNYNTATGFFALALNKSGSNNVAIGNNAMYSNNSGYSNVAIGAQALYKNQTGNHLIAIGDSALLNSVSASGNMAIGDQALFSNTSGTGNFAFGYKALYDNSQGISNIGMGSLALTNNTIGDDNISIGNSSLISNTTGNGNIALGAVAAQELTSGSNNTAIGTFADFNASNISNSTAIGASTTVDESNKIRIGNTTVLKIGGQVDWSVFSDGRYKQNIQENVPGLEFVNKLRPITYNVNIDELNKHYRSNVKTGSEKAKQLEKFDATMKSSNDKASKIVYTGFVAQEVEKASNELNYDFNGVDKPETKDNLYALRYAEFVVPLVKAVQELSKKNDELEKEVNELKSLIKTQSQNNAVSSQIKSTAARLEQNQPNPTSSSTIIKYFVPEQTSSAIIKITNSNGQEIKTLSISQKSNGQITLPTNNLMAGTYYYSLIVDGSLVDTKTIVIAH